MEKTCLSGALGLVTSPPYMVCFLISAFIRRFLPFPGDEEILQAKQSLTLPSASHSLEDHSSTPNFLAFLFL